MVDTEIESYAIWKVRTLGDPADSILTSIRENGDLSYGRVANHLCREFPNFIIVFFFI
jgi:hypothetical protein